VRLAAALAVRAPAGRREDAEPAGGAGHPLLHRAMQAYLPAAQNAEGRSRVLMARRSSIAR
jgi:hypothetical protein